MPRKGENIYKRKDGRWEGRYRKGRSAQGNAAYGYVYGKTYHDAKEKLRAAASSGGSDSQGFGAREHSSIRQNGSLEFGCLAWEWLESIRPQVKESTYIKYRNLLQSYILPEFRDRKLYMVTTDAIRNHCDALQAEGGSRQEGLSAKTVNDVLTVLRSILRYAQAKGIPMPCTGNEVTVRQSPGELSILQKEDQERICRYLTENPSNKALGVLIAMFTGLRIGEVCALEWDDISLTRKTLHVRQTMQRIQVEGDPKKKTTVTVTAPKSASSVRTIPLPDNLAEIILKEYPGQQGYVLSGGDGRYVEPRSLQRYFRKVLDECQVAPVNFHALRHTFATRCIEVGFDLKSLSEILGHSSVTITMDRYVHPTMELKDENMQRISALFAVKNSGQGVQKH